MNAYSSMDHAMAVVAFGPNNSFLLNSRTKWSRSGLPPSIEELITGDNKVRGILNLALGWNGSYCCVYEDWDGLHLVRSGLPASLNFWLGNSTKSPRDLGTLRVTLGPGDSYFAFDKNDTVRNSLPPALEAKIRSLMDPTKPFMSGYNPSCVALGYGGSFVYISESGYRYWDLRGQYESLEACIQQSDFSKTLYVALSSSTRGVYILTNRNGYCHGCIPSGYEAKLSQFVRDWERACHLLRKKPVLRPGANGHLMTPVNNNRPQPQPQPQPNSVPIRYYSQASPNAGPPPYSVTNSQAAANNSLVAANYSQAMVNFTETTANTMGIASNLVTFEESFSQLQL